MNETETLLPVGSTAVRRDVFRGRVWTEAPVRVLAADGDSVRIALWPGVVTMAAEKFVESGAGRDKALRAAALEDLARGDWGMAEWAWRWNGVVTEIVSDRWFSVARMYNQDGALDCWYVNFERPPSWHASGWDTLDLAVDLVVEPDGAWRWKDEDEYARCRRLGLVTDAEHSAVQAAREQAVAAVRAREGFFGEDAAKLWRPDPAWRRPALSDVPARPGN
jgi:predicted RNA-binding protein associated with RNAse of E/G family